MSTNFYEDNADLRWYVERGIDWNTLLPYVEWQGFGDEQAEAGGYQSVDEALETYREILTMVGAFAANEIAPHAAALDAEGLRLEDGEVVAPAAQDRIFDGINDLGLHALCVPREFDGMNAPLMLYMLTAEIFSRADVSVMTHHSFHGGIAMALLMYSALEGTTEVDQGEKVIVSSRFEDAIREIAAGEAWGCMDITEPDAGSDMAALRTRAVLGDDGVWRLTGQKIFITSGHGKWHFVIARTEDPAPTDDAFAGLKGLSLFLVQAYTDHPDGTRQRHVTVERIEEKLGHHGSATVALSFEDAAGELVGKRGEGFKYMLLLMNNARIGVGFEALGLIEASARMARSYAQGRTSMGKTIDQHEMIADYLDEMETDAVGIRALAVHSALTEEIVQRKRLQALYFTEEGTDERAARDAEVKALTWKSRCATPLLKYLAAERGVDAARRAIQIHGGVGYTREYGAERLLRDALVMPIYEGTSQIQSLMAMKDTLLGILKDPAGFVRTLANQQLLARTHRDPLGRRVATLRLHALQAQRHLITRIAGARFGQLRSEPLGTWRHRLVNDWDPKRDFGPALLHAERLTRLLADAAIGEILFEQVAVDAERRPLCAAWVERAEPRSRYLVDQIAHTGDRLLDQLRGTASGDPEAKAAAK